MKKEDKNYLIKDLNGRKRRGIDLHKVHLCGAELGEFVKTKFKQL